MSATKVAASGFFGALRNAITHLFKTNATERPTDIDYFQQQILRNTPLGILLVDACQPDQPIVYVNEAFERFTGYAAAEVIGKNCRFLQGTDRNQEGRALMRQAVDNQQACTVVLRNYRKDGSLFWNELKITPIYNPAGELTHFIGVQNDVTARIEAETALRYSNLRYQQSFDTNSAIKLVIDPKNGNIIDANKTAVAFYGYSLERLKTMRIGDINVLPPERIAQELANAANQDRAYFEFRHRLASGELRDVDVYSSPLDLPEGRFLYSIIIDVTGKRAADARYRALFDQSNDAVFILDFTGRHLQANRRAADMLGYRVDEILGLSVQDTVVPEEQPQSRSVAQRLLDGEHIPPYERTFRRKDGSHVPAEVNVEVVRDYDGRPLHLQSVVRDITERKQAEQNAFKFALEQERALLLTQFIQNAAHEFRTPLTIISSSTYLLARSDDPERRQVKARQVEAQVKQITKLTDLLLLMVKLESRESFHEVALNLRDVLEAHCQRAGVTYGNNPVIQRDIPPELPMIHGDAEHLEFVFNALIENAYRFTPAEGTVSVSAESGVNQVWVEVRDTGIGISDEDLPHIFETFWRRDEAHSTPGLGLGLSIAQRIVERHGGTLTVESALGRGSTFRVTLPAKTGL